MAELLARAEYGADVASPSLAAMQARRLELVARPMRKWSVPTEMAVGLTSSVWAKVIRNRRRRGPKAKPMATVMRIDGKLYANVAFYGSATDLFFPLDQVDLWENR